MSAAAAAPRRLPVRLWITARFLALRAAERCRSWLPPERLQRLQDRRARRIVAHAWATVPFYREAMAARGLTPADFSGAADLARLPLVGGDDLAAAPERFRSSLFPPDRALEVATTGTSGRLKRVAHDDRGLVTAFAAGARQQRVLREVTGLRGPLRTLSLLPPEGTGLALAAWWNAHSLRPPRRGAHAGLLSVTTPAAEAVATLNRARPDVLSGFGAAIGHVYRWAHEHGREVWRPRAVLYGGDHLPEAERRLLEEDLGIPVVSIYQACEALMIAVQCERRQGHHISSDLVHLRVADEDGRDLPPGASGGIVVSNLVNRATVLLNYRLGDRGALSAEPCPCGRTLPVLARLEGRADDLLVRTDGGRVHESVVLKGLYSVAGVLEVRVVQHDLRRVGVELVVAPGTDGEEVTRRVERTLHHLLGADPAVAVAARLVAEIPPSAGGKRRMVVSHCAAAS